MKLKAGELHGCSDSAVLCTYIVESVGVLLSDSVRLATRWHVGGGRCLL